MKWMLLATVVGSLGCGKKEAPTPLTWEERERCGQIGLPFHPADRCAELAKPQAMIAASIRGSELWIGGSGFPDGTVLKSGVTEVRSASDSMLIKLPFPSLAKLSVKEVLVDELPVDPQASFDLVLPDAATLTTQLPKLRVRSGLVQALEDAKGQLAFPGEGPPPTTHTVLFAKWNVPRVVFGPAATLEQIDWVALPAEMTRAEIGTCYYEPTSRTRPSAGGRIDLPKIGIGETITIVDRRTGAKIDSKDFPVTDGACEERPASNATEIVVRADPAQIVAWLEARVAQP